MNEPSHFTRKTKILILSVLILIIALLACSGSDTTGTTNATSNQSAATSAPTQGPTQAPTKPPKWVTTHTFKGNGDKQTAVFHVPDDWKLLWSCDARNSYGVDGFLGVNVYNSDGTMSDAGDVSGTCTANKITSDSTEEHQAGDVYLKVYAGLPWTLTIQELK